MTTNGIIHINLITNLATERELESETTVANPFPSPHAYERIGRAIGRLTLKALDEAREQDAVVTSQVVTIVYAPETKP